MRRLWLSLLLVPVMVAAMALPISGAAWASPAAPAARSAPAARTAAAAALLISGRALQPGMSGSAVKALQRRLAALKYYPGSIDGRFGTSTLEAVWAFYEVQGLTPHNYVSSAMKRALAHPRAPKKLVSHGGANRIEVSLSREVLVLYRNNQVQLISHVSTGGHYHYCSPGGGCGYAVTPTGNYHTVVFMRGWVHVPLGEMFNPVFFIGTAFAIHGDTDVPLAPVSHGCVRIPMDIANFFHKLVKIPGEPVYIR
jgi:L,D-transpeptidase catalytic domain/Putative peptidoglycan binding domain